MTSAPVLVVSASPSGERAPLDALAHAGYPVVEATGLHSAAEVAERSVPRMVVIDASGEEEAPLPLVLGLRRAARTAHVPVLVLRAGRPLRGEDALCELGGVRCLPHPFQLRWLLQEVQYLTARSATGGVVRRTRRKESVLFEVEAGTTEDRSLNDIGARAPLPALLRRSLPVPAAAV